MCYSTMTLCSTDPTALYTCVYHHGDSHTYSIYHWIVGVVVIHALSLYAAMGI